MKSRDYRHLSLAGISFAVDVNNGTARIAVALCSEEDNFNRNTGRTILDLLLDGSPETLTALSLTRNVFQVYYSGKQPRAEVIAPLLESLIDVLNERSLYRELKSLFLQGINTYETAREVAKAKNDQRFHKRFVSCANVLEQAGDLKVLKNITTLKEFERFFFTWRGSAEAILDGVVKFAHNFVFTEKKPEEAPKSETPVTAATEACPEGVPATQPDEDDVVARFLLQKSELHKMKLEQATPPSVTVDEPCSVTVDEPCDEPTSKESELTGIVPDFGG